MLLNPVLVEPGSWQLLVTHLVHLNPASNTDGLLKRSRPSATEGHEPVQVAAKLVDPRAGCADGLLFGIVVLAFAALLVFNALCQPILASPFLACTSPSDGLNIFDDLIEKAFWRDVKALVTNDTPLQTGEAAGS